jgi:hypothetical protein
MTWLFILIPLAGPIIVIVFWAQEGNSGDNKYGSDPKSGKGQQKSPANKAEKATAKGKQVFCSERDKKNESGTKFCGSCGKKL